MIIFILFLISLFLYFLSIITSDKLESKVLFILGTFLFIIVLICSFGTLNDFNIKVE